MLRVGEKLAMGPVGRKVAVTPKTRASAQAVPVIRQLAEILNAYRLSMGNPQSGVIFHSGADQHMDLDKLGQNIIRPAVEALRLEWYGWHGFRRGIASNYELGATIRSSSASYGMQNRT